MPELAVIMPVYNEEAAIEAVVHKWVELFRQEGIDFVLHVYNDGSRDNSGAILGPAQQATSRNYKLHHKENTGHGPTILKGYRENRQTDWLFQIDSDDELGTRGFSSLWQHRDQYDFLIGTRTRRKAPLSRKLITLLTALTVRIFYGKGIADVNCPFRLMRSEAFRELYQQIPSNTFAPNVIISGFACRNRLRIYQTPIIHHFRTTGEVSIRHWKLAKAAIQSFLQTIRFRFR